MKKITGEQAMSISALITAVVAVWIAVIEQRSNREYQRLSVEIDVSINGKNISSWREALKILTSDDNNTSFIVSDLWSGRQVKAGEEIALLHIDEGKTAKEFHSNVGKLDMKICYCSMYNECWIKRSSEIPHPVAQCAIKSKQSFSG